MSQNHPDATPVQMGMPMDVLCAIFEVLRDTDRSHSGQSKFEPSLHWVPEATHVCRYWRDAALSARYLWTNINVAASITWALEFARRSGNAPICILVQPSPSYPRHSKVFECTKTLLHENMQRILKISFKGLSNREETLIVNALSDDTHSRTGVGPAFYPILQDLKISFYSASRFLLTNDTIRAPELKRLSLARCAVGVEFGSFRNLSHLSISGNASPIILPHRLHRVLSQTPNLETLILHPGFEPIAVDSDIIQPVILPKLLQIEIRGNVEWAYAILQLISYGPQRNLTVHSHRIDNHSERIFSLFTSIMSHTRESSSICHLQICLFSFNGGLSLCAGRRLTSQNIHFSVVVSPQTELPIFYLLDWLLRRMNYQDLRVLQFGSNSGSLSTRFWVELFGSLPWLAAIDISGGERELFGALIDETGNIPVRTNMLNVGGDQFPFRALEGIQIRGRRELYPEKDIDFMLKCLRKRLDFGMGINGLFFCSCPRELKSQFDVFRDVVVWMDFEEYPRAAHIFLELLFTASGTATC